MRILHLIDSLEFSDSARQLRILAPAQLRDGAQVEIGCFGLDAGFAAELRQAGVPVNALGWTRWFDISVWWNLRDNLRIDPQVIHAWDLASLRAIAAIAPSRLPRVIMSGPLPRDKQLAWWDRRLLNRVRRVSCAAVQKRGQIPFVEKAAHADSIVCVGSGFDRAILALDMLLHLLPQTQLHLVGAGAGRPRLLALAQGMENAGNIQFHELSGEVDQRLQSATIVWAPATNGGERQLLLEAMAAGRPVIAADSPSVREVLHDGVTGWLVPPGDAVALARRTYSLLRDVALKAHVGEAARAHVESHCSLQGAVATWREVYRDMCIAA